jgi:hypothetical protein
MMCQLLVILTDAINNLIDTNFHVKWLPGYHGMARFQVVDGDRLQIWRIAANILNKQLRMADKG